MQPDTVQSLRVTFRVWVQPEEALTVTPSPWVSVMTHRSSSRSATSAEAVASTRMADPWLL